MLPPATVHVRAADPSQRTSCGATEVTEYVTKVSEALQPVPVTVMVVPVVAELGVSVNSGLITVNVTEIDPCTTAPPDIVTVCAPKVAVRATVYDPVRTPLAEMAHVTELKVGDGVPTIAAEQSGVLAEYPDPEIDPELPRLLLLGVSMKVDVTVKLTGPAGKPLGFPVAVTV